LARSGIKLVTPDPAEQVEIDEIYLSELVAGIIRPMVGTGSSRLPGGSVTMPAIETLILGGTELPLILLVSCHGES